MNRNGFSIISAVILVIICKIWCIDRSQMGKRVTFKSNRLAFTSANENCNFHTTPLPIFSSRRMARKSNMRHRNHFDVRSNPASQRYIATFNPNSVRL